MIVTKQHPQCLKHMLRMVKTEGLYKGYYICPHIFNCEMQANYSHDTRQFYITDAEERRYRILAHSAFDTLWKSGQYSRSQAYHLLRDALKLPKRACHIAQFDKEQCMSVIELVEAIIDSEMS